MNCPNCSRPVPDGAETCLVCAADLTAAPPAAARSRTPVTAWISIVLGAGGLATETAGAAAGSLYYVIAGYFASSMAFRLGRFALAQIDDPLAPGPRPAGHVIAFWGRRLGLAGMILGVPVGVLVAWLRYR